MVKVTVVEKKKITSFYTIISLLIVVLSMSFYSNYKQFMANKQVNDQLAKQQIMIDALTFERDNLSLMLLSKEERISRIAKYIKNVRPALTDEKAKILAEAHIDAAIKHKVAISIGLAINKQETHFDCSLTSYNNTSYGCMQINYNAQKEELGIKSKQELFDPEKNIDYGYQVIANKIKQSNGDIRQALWRYYGWKKEQTFHLTYAVQVLEKAFKIKEIIS